MTSGLRIGVDFDNTIVGYDDLFQAAARDMGISGSVACRGKTAIRDALRSGPEGDIAWTRLQVSVYGDRISDARPIDGVRDFFAMCRMRGIPVFIVSHKTAFCGDGRQDVNLREVARGWLRSHGFFSSPDSDLPERNLFFESTRADKIARIASLELTHFVDDLIEVFLEPSFPNGTSRYLLAPHGANRVPAPIRAFSSWRDIQHDVFPFNS